MSSRLVPAHIELPTDSHTVHFAVSQFLDYIMAIHDGRLNQIPDLYGGPPVERSYMTEIHVRINDLEYVAHPVEILNQHGEAANLVICYAKSHAHDPMFFTIQKHDGTWTPNHYCLFMNWDEFKQLSKAQQCAALNI
jgi:hypothetical protein